VTNLITAASNPVVLLDKLVWPRYSAVNGTVSRIIISNVDNTQKEAVTSIENLGPPTSPQFTSATVSANNKGLGFTNCQYTFTLKPANEIIQGGEIIITFPSIYSLVNSNPLPTLSATGLLGYPTSTISLNSFVISNFSATTVGTEIVITVFGIKNPSAATVSGGWTIQSQIRNSLGTNVINRNTNVGSFTMETIFTSGRVTFNQITATPRNALASADYTFSFTLTNDIPAFGEIQIKFPSANYSILPSILVCGLSGGLSSFSSCAFSGSTLLITTDSPSISKMINVSVSTIQNPSAVTLLSFSLYFF